MSVKVGLEIDTGGEFPHGLSSYHVPGEVSLNGSVFTDWRTELNDMPAAEAVKWLMAAWVRFSDCSARELVAKLIVDCHNHPKAIVTVRP